MTRSACHAGRQYPVLIARGTDFTTIELEGMERDFQRARATPGAPSDQELVVRIIRSYVAARKAA